MPAQTKMEKSYALRECVIADSWQCLGCSSVRSLLAAEGMRILRRDAGAADSSTVRGALLAYDILTKRLLEPNYIPAQDQVTGYDLTLYAFMQ